jgi:hypothetical protein
MQTLEEQTIAVTHEIMSHTFHCVMRDMTPAEAWQLKIHASSACSLT